jgi:hypothetical protein
VLPVLGPYCEKRPRGNPLLRKGVQPPWLKPYNTGRKRGSKNRPKPKEPELIELRFLELTPADEALMAAPPTPEETEELICHFRDIRRQRDRWLRYVRRYQPWRLIGGFNRNRQGPKGLGRRRELASKDPDQTSVCLSLAVRDDSGFEIGSDE